MLTSWGGGEIIHYLSGNTLLCPLLAVWSLGLSFFLCQTGSSLQPSRVTMESNQDPHQAPALPFPIPDPSSLRSALSFRKGAGHAVSRASVRAPSPGVRGGREPALRGRGAVLTLAAAPVLPP